ncbi:M1 family metallopeptidase [Maribacter sp. 2304DJ31-5]|uniref:M1 family metallopeptidase n=1 Tax=Maribacter sp. 2304DJ31-5 TaxID=3386273 RepID=UPI0039BCA927
MKLFSFLSCLVLFFFSCRDKSVVTTKIQDGVSLELASHRSKQVTEVVYKLAFQIPLEKEAPIVSELVLEVSISEAKAPLYLDFKEETSRLRTIEANGQHIPIAHNNEHIRIAEDYLLLGKNIIKIHFLAGESSLNRNEEYLYTLLVPDRARTLFPCFDQPNIKAKYILDISTPKDWKVICGAPEIRTEEKDGFTRHQFAPSDKMSTYLFSFVAGKFNTINKKPHSLGMNLLYRENNKEKIKSSTNTIFDLHQRSLSFLEAYTAYPFPFQKLDFVTVPGFQYGGMEHVGAIQYRESSLFLDESATENQKLRRAKLIAHETAHMWFGDLVTMDWFNDVWMKEVFANFMADKIVNPAFPDINHELAFMTAHYPRAYNEDRTLGTNPIRQNLDNLNNAGSLYGNIIYNKAPIMMRQLEKVMGKEAFQKGIKEYIKRYADSNAVWNDLIKILDKETDITIENWSNVWVNNASRPIFEHSLTYDDKGNISNFELLQKAEDKTAKIWPQTFDIALVYNDHIKTITIDVKGKKKEIQQALGLPRPNAIIYNSNGLGYGVFPISKKDLDIILSLKDDVTRGYAYINVYENTLNGKIEAKHALELYQKSLLIEENELLVNLVSGYTSSIFWTFLNVEQRTLYQQRLADHIWSKLKGNAQPNIKKTLFSVFRSIAYSESAKARLYQVWNKDIHIKDLKLNEDDYTRMAIDLALYEHPRQDEIIEIAKERIGNPDKLERFIFLLPSISKKETTRNAFFKSLKEEKNRAKESWVLAALNNLNHPLRQKEAIVTIRPSLDLLEEIQKTGDIFFPKGWLNNTIGNHTSPEAYAILEGFIAENPNLNPSLMKKLLQATDNLRRVRSLHKNIDASVK